MLDINLIRNKTERVKENLKRRDKDYVKMLDEVLKKDGEWRKLKTKNQELQHKRNVLSRKIGELKAGKKDAKKEMKEVSGIPAKIKKNNEKIDKLRKECDLLLLKIPNLIHDSVPEGKEEKDNVEIGKWGKPPEFKGKSHLEVGRKGIDFEAGARASGSLFTYLKDDMVLLDLALLRFAVDFLVKKGYKLVEPPYLVNKRVYEAMIGDPTELGEASYKIDGEELYLIPTAEYPLGGMFLDKTLNKSELPVKLVGVSSCFRREVGTHGKYAKGLFRMHQFNKVEQIIVCLPNESWEFFEELQKNCEELYQKLGLHYRVVNVCSGKLGKKQAKTYDVEAWMADGKFREVGSNSNCTDYQARRLGIKFREKEGRPPAGYVHILNNTALATSRTMIAILEQFQQKDGSVLVPEALQPYMNGKKVIKFK
ncbi:MAG: serine--tRNA ligase [archaeon]|nr:MAG: serine--tRNA ligase [archaeon]